MKLILQRGSPGSVSIPGELFLSGSHECFTLENKELAIPAGTYKLSIYKSNHLGGALVPLLNDVPGRSYIEMHWGTFYYNYKGCIGVGEQRSLETEEIFSTQAAFKELFPVIQAAVNTEGCEIEVLDAIAPITNGHQDDL